MALLAQLLYIFDNLPFLFRLHSSAVEVDDEENAQKSMKILLFLFLEPALTESKI